MNYENCISLPNIGREGHTYFHHIINNYENLPDILIFLPGSAMDEHYNKKQKTSELMQQIANGKILERCSLNKGENHFDSLKDFQIDDYVSTNTSNSNINPENKLLKASPRPFGKWFETNFPTIKRIPAVWYNGILCVRKEQILRFPKEFYINLYNQLNTHSSPEVGHYMERAWGAIFCDGL